MPEPLCCYNGFHLLTGRGPAHMAAGPYLISMKKLLLILALTVVSAVPIPAQVAPTPAQAPEFAALAAKYKADVDALNAARDLALAAPRKPYLGALDAGEQKATASGRTDALKAVLEEKQTVAAGSSLPPTPSPALPRDLVSARVSYIREVARVGHDFAPRFQQLAGTYLRALSPLEIKARTGSQKALLEQITAEKLKLAGQASATTTAEASHPPGKNLLVNGEFSQKNADGTPVGWSNVVGTIETENGVNFLRFSRGMPEQRMKCPPDKKEVTISARLRCPDLQLLPGEDGYDLKVNIKQYDENGKMITPGVILALPLTRFQVCSGLFIAAQAPCVIIFPFSSYCLI